MSIAKNIFLYTLNDIIHFSSESQIGLSYLIHSTNENIELYNKNVLEFDVDIDRNGNIGVVLLDCDGKFLFYFHDGETWTRHLLYEVDLDFEEIHHISIEFSLNSPYIVFCWRNFSSHDLWSIVSYYKENSDWKKQVVNRIYFKGNIKPYVLIRNNDYQLYLIYLNTNNIIYDLFMITLPAQSSEWTEPCFLSNCIFVKYFCLDAVFDSNDNIHISWTDKHKKKYCISYISINTKKNNFSNTVMSLEIDTPFMSHQLFYEENQIICYGITKENIYYSVKTTDQPNWTSSQALNLAPPSIYLLKIIQYPSSPFIKYNANYILSSSLSNMVPLSITTHPSIEDIKIDPVLQITAPSTEKNSNAINTSSTSSIKKLKFELYKKSQEIEVKNNLIHSLKGNISYLQEEITRIREQNKNYISIIHKNNEKYKHHHQDMEQLHKEHTKTRSDYETSQKKNKEILQQLKTYQQQLILIKEDVDRLNTENVLLKKEIHELKNMNLLKKLFFQ